MAKDETQTITDTLKKLILETIENTKPTTIVIGKITKLSPFTIQADVKMPLTSTFLILTETVRDKELKIGDKMILIRIKGGQRYVVVDRM